METILISGSTGFIATSLRHTYQNKYKFICLSHKNVGNHLTYTDLAANPKIIEAVNIVINLAGANIGAKRWSKKRKAELLDSRIITTQNLVNLFNQYNPSAHFISASAVGIYMPNIECNDETEIDYQQIENFSQQITKEWELAARNYTGPLCITRFGVVLSSQNGAFPQMLIPFMLGLGGKLGSGTQYFPWIALSDLLQALDIIIQRKATGIYTLAAPEAITNAQLSTEIASIWKRPCWLHLPELLIKIIFGQMGKELFLNSILVKPTRLLKEGFKYNYPNISSALQAINKKQI